MILTPLSTACDLSEASLEWAQKELVIESKALYTSVGESLIGNGLARKRNLLFFIDTELPRNAWYITGIYRGIFSLGA